MRRSLQFLAVLLGCCAAMAADPGADSLPERIEVPAMKTSIYVGSVTLETSPFARNGSAFAASYQARVFPWAFWSERGEITIAVPEQDLTRLLAGETIEFTGDALNKKGKSRSVTGRATPEDPSSGSIKVRIDADGIELVFNGRYRFESSEEQAVGAPATPRDPSGRRPAGSQ